MAEKGNLIGLRRGFAILKHLAASREGLAFKRLAELTGLPAPTLSRILKTLVDERMAAKNGTYSLGPEFMALARAAAGTASRAELLQGILETLGRDTGESAAYYEVRDCQISCIAKAEQSESFHYMQPGGLNPRILQNGFGQVCTACMTADEQKLVLAAADPGPSIPMARFLARLEQIRQDRIFVEKGEAKESLIRIVAPVFTAQDAFAGSLGITLLKRRLGKAELERLKEQVSDAAREALLKIERY